MGGGIVWGTSIYDYKVANMPETPADIRDLFRDILADAHHPVCYMEMVSGFAGNRAGTSHSGFVFGENAGALLGILSALEVPVIRPRPQAWQKALGLGPSAHLSKSQHKGRLKARAQQLFAKEKVTLKNADALLIFHLACEGELKPF